MVKATILTSNFDEKELRVIIETDLVSVDGGKVAIELSILRSDATAWLADNTTSTFQDYFLMRVKNAYNAYKSMNALSGWLKDKTFNW